MKIAILHNHDFTHLPDDVNRRSEEAVLGVVQAAVAALRAGGAEVQIIPVGRNPVAFVPRLIERRPDVVLNLCESLNGDPRGEMLVPGLLDLLGLPYTGSGPLTLALALQKHKAKDVLRACGIPTPGYHVVRSLEQVREVALGFPLIVKPVHEDASIGIDRDSVVGDAAALERACRRVLEVHAQPALVEEYIEGRELNVALLGCPAEALPIGEIDLSGIPPDMPRIVTYAAKWDEDSAEFRDTPPKPCQLSPEVERHVQQVARDAWAALEGSDYGRVDLRLTADSQPYVIEVNPNCDLSPGAGFARAAQAAGIDYEALIWRLIDLAKARSHEHPTPHLLRPQAAGADARKDRGVPARRSRLRARAGRPDAR